MKLGLSTKQLSLQLRQALKPITAHHVIIAFVVVMGALIYAVFTVNSILTQPADQAYIAQKEAEGVRTKFDEKTIQQIDSLYRSETRESLKLPTRRLNPFVEGQASYDIGAYRE